MPTLLAGVTTPHMVDGATFYLAPTTNLWVQLWPRWPLDNNNSYHSNTPNAFYRQCLVALAVLCPMEGLAWVYPQREYEVGVKSADIATVHQLYLFDQTILTQ